MNNSLFKDKSVYFRNSMVRSNYFNNYLKIKKDNNLHSENLIVHELFDKYN